MHYLKFDICMSNGTLKLTDLSRVKDFNKQADSYLIQLWRRLRHPYSDRHYIRHSNFYFFLLGKPEGGCYMQESRKEKNGISILRWPNKVFKFETPFAFAMLYNKEFKIIVKENRFIESFRFYCFLYFVKSFVTNRI